MAKAKREGEGRVDWVELRDATTRIGRAHSQSTRVGSGRLTTTKRHPSPHSLQVEGGDGVEAGPVLEHAVARARQHEVPVVRPLHALDGRVVRLLI